MTDSSAAADSAIQKLLETYQKLADEEKSLVPRREAAAQKIESLVDDFASMETFDEQNVSSETIAAFLVFQQQTMQKMMMGDPSAQMAMSKFDENFIKDFNDYMKNVKGDQAKVMEIQQAMDDLMADMQPPKIRTGMPTIEIAVSQPSDDTGEWTFAVVPIIVDENFQAKVADKLDFDLYLSMEFTPRDGLSEQFNIPGQVTRAGDKYEPLSVTAETVPGEAPKHLHVRGAIYKDQQLVQELNFPVLALQKRGAVNNDMDMFMQMLENDAPGPHGPH